MHADNSTSYSIVAPPRNPLSIPYNYETKDIEQNCLHNRQAMLRVEHDLMPRWIRAPLVEMPPDRGAPIDSARGGALELVPEGPPVVPRACDSAESRGLI